MSRTRWSTKFLFICLQAWGIAKTQETDVLLPTRVITIWGEGGWGISQCNQLTVSGNLRNLYIIKRAANKSFNIYKCVTHTYMYPYTEIYKMQYKKNPARAFVYFGITLPCLFTLYISLRKVPIYTPSLNQQ